MIPPMLGPLLDELCPGTTRTFQRADIGGFYMETADGNH